MQLYYIVQNYSRKTQTVYFKPIFKTNNRKIRNTKRNGLFYFSIKIDISTTKLMKKRPRLNSCHSSNEVNIYTYILKIADQSLGIVGLGQQAPSHDPLP